MIKRSVFWTLLFLISILVTLALGELIVRLTIAKEKVTSHVDARLFQTSREFGWILAPNASILHSPTDYSIRYNTIYGDSFAFGMGVKDNETFASYLSQMLPSAMVRNHGVIGYSPDQYYLKFRNDLLDSSSQPDFAIFAMFLFNDVLDINRPYSRTLLKGKKITKPLIVNGHAGFKFTFPDREFYEEDNSQKYNTYKPGLVTFLKRLKLLSFFYKRIKGVPQLSWLTRLIQETNASYIRHDLINQGVDRIRFITNNIISSKVPALFVLIPTEDLLMGGKECGYEDTAYNEVKELLVRSRLPVVDVASLLPKKHGYYYPHDGHWTKKTHRIVAEKLLSEMHRLGLLGETDKRAISSSAHP
jgi:hypothetical protein